jgi:glutathione S-transferase
MYKLYGRRQAGSMVVEAALEEIGAPYELVNVKRDAAKRPAPEYFGINPLGQVPSLLLPDGSIMTESAAILLYLCDKHGEAGLAPAPDSALRAPFLRWTIFLATNIYMSDLRLYYPHRYTTRPENAAEVKAAALEAMAREWKIYAEALGAKTYSLGERFTILDVYVAMLATWNLDVPAFFRLHPNVKALYDRIVARPAIARVWQRHAVSF